MSNVSMSGSHQVSISHDPIEEHTSAGRDQLHARRDQWPSGGMRPSRQPSGRMSDMLPSIDASDLRPALLAGAIGLFVAWIVSGMNGSRRPQSGQRRGGGYVGGRDEWSRRQNFSQPTGGQSPRYSAGPEGQSSRADLSLDAMNP